MKKLLTIILMLFVLTSFGQKKLQYDTSIRKVYQLEVIGEKDTARLYSIGAKGYTGSGCFGCGENSVIGVYEESFSDDFDYGITDDTLLISIETKIRFIKIGEQVFEINKKASITEVKKISLDPKIIFSPIGSAILESNNIHLRR